MSDLKWLLVSDLHIPFHNKRWVDMWLDVVKWMKPDVVDILGDLDDACPVSRFAAGTPLESQDTAVTYAPLIKQFFADLREILPNAEIHFATGNHEIRYDNYIAKNAPALSGLITPELLWGTDKSGIVLSYYSNPPVHRFGDIYVHHGPYADPKSGNSVYKVLDDFHVSAIVGHSHRQAYVAKSYPLAGKELRGIELGHLTDINSSGMAYDMKHNWQAGFAHAHIVDDYPHLSLVGIHDNRCVVDGKTFAA
jgi:UDP-2,3-diacylglucosamine pyrophosphatase LpxH